MYGIFESVIKNGGYKLSDMMERLDSYAAKGKITLTERDLLTAMARDHSNAGDELDLRTLVMQHELRIRALEEGRNQTAGTKLEEYTVGTPTIAGQRWLWKGEEYEVVNATVSNPCVWSPDEYPYYWRKVE